MRNFEPQIWQIWRTWLIWLVLVLAFGCQISTAQSELATLPSVVGARVLNNPDRARLVLDLTDPTQYATASLAMPNRLVVDLRVTSIAEGLEPQISGAGLVSGYEVTMVEDGRGRATLSLSVPAQVQQAYVLEGHDDQPARLVVDLIPDSPEHFAARVALDYAMAQTRSDDAPPPNPVPTAPASSDPRSRPLIVIDPGHGGVDLGAKTPDGILEKDIVLSFARELQRLLVESGRFDVALTREGDSFLRLEERVALARDNKADLFISIHADTFEDSSVRGASIYIRDERATDVLDKVLAEHENRADIVAGFTPPDTDGAVVNILVDLMRREMRRQSYKAAQDMTRNLERSVRMRKFALRQADFFVLQAPDIPSVLVELGFLSNNDDIANLTTGGWRDKTAEALANGISSYFDALDLN